jgi:hypothetical protein
LAEVTPYIIKNVYKTRNKPLAMIIALAAHQMDIEREGGERERARASESEGEGESESEGESEGERERGGEREKEGEREIEWEIERGVGRERDGERQRGRHRVSEGRGASDSKSLFLRGCGGWVAGCASG